MSRTIQRVMQLIEELAPKSLAYDWDNVGLQLGDPKHKVEKVLVALTLTEDLVQRAIDENIDLIVVHHPVIFRPLKHLRTDLPVGRLLARLIRHEIGIYVCHTNLDQAEFGLNHWLAEQLELTQVEVLVPNPQYPGAGLGRIGYSEARTLKQWAQYLQQLWQTDVRIVGDPSQVCKKVAVAGGSGGDLVGRAHFLGADLLITGDVKYHDALDASQLGLVVIDAGHFGTEQIMVDKIGEYLQQQLPDIIVLQGQEDNPLMFL